MTLALALAACLTLGSVIYVATAQKSGEKFTEFYVLNADGSAASYPTEFTVGETATVTVGLTNREQQPATYMVDVVVDGKTVSEIDGISLADGEQWRGRVSFAFARSGASQKVDFLLYRSPVAEPYRSIFLRLDVTEPEQTEPQN